MNGQFIQTLVSIEAQRGESRYQALPVREIADAIDRYDAIQALALLTWGLEHLWWRVNITEVVGDRHSEKLAEVRERLERVEERLEAMATRVERSPNHREPAGEPSVVYADGEGRLSGWRRCPTFVARDRSWVVRLSGWLRKRRAGRLGPKAPRAESWHGVAFFAGVAMDDQTRALQLLRLLAERGRTVRELMAALGVSEKTARRDLEALKAAGLPLRGIVGQRGLKRWRLTRRDLLAWLQGRDNGARKPSGRSGPGSHA